LLHVIDLPDDRRKPQEADIGARQRGLDVQHRNHAATGTGPLSSAIGYSGGPLRLGSSLSGYGHRTSRRLAYDLDETRSVSCGPGPGVECVAPQPMRVFRDVEVRNWERKRDSTAGTSGDGSSSREWILSTHRDNSGSVTGPPPLRGQVRSPSERTIPHSISTYDPENGHPNSRVGYSEVGSVVGASSGTRYGQGDRGLMNKPTFPLPNHSNESDTQKVSTSTNASELSGYLAHEGECEWEDVRVMRENHATEISALLSALADSHRTVNNLREENGLLREENGQLRNGRDRFVDIVRESKSLREACTKLEMERSHIPNANTRD